MPEPVLPTSCREVMWPPEQPVQASKSPQEWLRCKNQNTCENKTVKCRASVYLGALKLHLFRKHIYVRSLATVHLTGFGFKNSILFFLTICFSKSISISAAPCPLLALTKPIAIGGYSASSPQFTATPQFNIITPLRYDNFRVRGL